jgi:hypothetical protein
MNKRRKNGIVCHGTTVPDEIKGGITFGQTEKGKPLPSRASSGHGPAGKSLCTFPD